MSSENKPVANDEPPPDLIDRCAQRIASWDDGCVWPDSWDANDVARMRLDAKRVLLEAREWIFETARRPAIESAGVLCTPEGSWEIADAARVIAWARDPQRKPAAQAFTAGPERQAAYWIEWSWAEVMPKESHAPVCGTPFPGPLRCGMREMRLNGLVDRPLYTCDVPGCNLTPRAQSLGKK